MSTATSSLGPVALSIPKPDLAATAPLPPVNTEIDMIADLMSKLSNYHSFTELSLFPKYLYNRIVTAVDDVNSINNAISDGAVNNFLSLVAKYVPTSINPSLMSVYFMPTTIAASIYNANTFATKLESRFKSPKPALGPPTSPTIMNEYLYDMQVTFGYVFFMVYSSFAAQLNSNAANYVTYGNYDDNFRQHLDTAVNEAVRNEAFDVTQTLAVYIANCKANYMNYATQQLVSPRNKLFEMLFNECMTPYFTYRYISKFVVTSPSVQAVERGSRNAFVRRNAILCMYMYQAYTLYSIYQAYASANPASQNVIKIRNLIDSSVFNPFIQEYNAMMHVDMASLNNKAQDTLHKTNTLQAKAREIEMSRDNITTVLSAEPKLNKELKLAKGLKWFWLSMLVVYIVFYLVVVTMMYFIGTSKPQQAATLFRVVQIVSLVYVFGLCISAIIYVVKKLY